MVPVPNRFKGLICVLYFFPWYYQKENEIYYYNLCKDQLLREGITSN